MRFAKGEPPDPPFRVQLHRKLRTIYHWWGSWYAVADALGTTQKRVAYWVRYSCHPNIIYLAKIDAEYLICIERLRRYHRKHCKNPWLIEDTVATLEWEENLELLAQQAEAWLLRNSLTGIFPPDTIVEHEQTSETNEGPKATRIGEPGSGANRETGSLSPAPENREAQNRELNDSST